MLSFCPSHFVSVVCLLFVLLFVNCCPRLFPAMFERSIKIYFLHVHLLKGDYQIRNFQIQGSYFVFVVTHLFVLQCVYMHVLLFNYDATFFVYTIKCFGPVQLDKAL